jgi:E3 ubiquitin-protein ligase synoviolin
VVVVCFSSPKASQETGQDEVGSVRWGKSVLIHNLSSECGNSSLIQRLGLYGSCSWCHSVRFQSARKLLLSLCVSLAKQLVLDGMLIVLHLSFLTHLIPAQILTNLILFIIASFMFGLQRIFYGPLRPIEIEQLYEKAWFAVTETCLAMTIFREEVGAWFLVMFVALLAGKVWGWIGEGRVEVLEQQPPENPRLVHTRLSLSLSLSLAYDLYILAYTIRTVIQQARPNMMVMFLFEFAILATSSSSTALRYCISLVDARIVKQQTAERLEWRRREVREEREEILRQRAAAAATATESVEPVPELPALPSEDDIDEMDIEVPGWEAKGHWVLTLDLMTGMLGMRIYSGYH